MLPRPYGILCCTSGCPRLKLAAKLPVGEVARRTVAVQRSGVPRGRGLRYAVISTFGLPRSLAEVGRFSQLARPCEIFVFDAVTTVQRSARNKDEVTVHELRYKRFQHLAGGSGQVWGSGAVALPLHPGAGTPVIDVTSVSENPREPVALTLTALAPQLFRDLVARSPCVSRFTVNKKAHLFSPTLICDGGHVGDEPR